MAGAGFGGPLLNIWKLEKKIRKFAENYRGHSYPLWNIGGERANIDNFGQNFNLKNI